MTVLSTATTEICPTTSKVSSHKNYCALSLQIWAIRQLTWAQPSKGILWMQRFKRPNINGIFLWEYWSHLIFCSLFSKINFLQMIHGEIIVMLYVRNKLNCQDLCVKGSLNIWRWKVQQNQHNFDYYDRIHL